MESTAAYFREKAAQCRRLAASVGIQTDPAVLALLQMAGEFDANADALEGQAAREAAHLSRGEELPPLH
ncbi:hypothetical protein ASG52_25080 [Methylobacterium sp. Leaf456]|nr:hypothetical protein ASG52_25080 [Methylobacterium sp. Leaf456]